MTVCYLYQKQINFQLLMQSFSGCSLINVKVLFFGSYAFKWKIIWKARNDIPLWPCFTNSIFFYLYFLQINPKINVVDTDSTKRQRMSCYHDNVLPWIIHTSIYRQPIRYLNYHLLIRKLAIDYNEECYQTRSSLVTLTFSQCLIFISTR